MIHTYLVFSIAALALAVRWHWHQRSEGVTEHCTPDQWSKQWWWARVALVLPSLWLLNGWIAILLMGSTGTMWGHSVSRWGSVLAGLGLAWAIAQLAIAWYQGRRSIAAVETLPTVEIEGQSARLLEQPLPYAAQVGFWRSQLVVSQGLLDQLTPEQVKAVLAHETAHATHHDTFTFFWLGWLHRLVSWLRGSERLWQEVLLLREIRADQQAAIATDPLDVAEALLILAQSPLQPAAPLSTAMATDTADGGQTGGDRLDRRVQALIQQTQTSASAQPVVSPDRFSLTRLTPTLWSWGLMGLAACPLLIITLHH